MKSCIFILTFLFSFHSLAADFSAFQTLLNRHLKDISTSNNPWQTTFDYQGAKGDKNTKELIEKQKKILKEFDPKTIQSKNEALAFWINSYNFFMISDVLEKGFKGEKLKIESVKDLGSWLNPYAIFKEENLIIGGKKFSLDKIEKETLLGEEFKKKEWKDARIHFAVNCASVGCPPLHPKVYNAKTLEETLDKNIEKSIKTKRHVHTNGENVYVTHLFKWYKSDFDDQAGSVKKFLLKYVKDAKLKQTIEKDPAFSYIEYDWRLNKPENFK